MDATLQIASGIDLEGALRCFLDTTCRMVGARYGAIGLVGREHLVRFVPAGTSADAAASLVQRPENTGGPMHSFLGVPITVGGEAFGTVYLAGKCNGTGFSGQDRALVRALASAAGVAIEHAELLDEARRRQDWLRAGATITTLLLSGEDPQEVRSVVAGHAMQLDAAAAAAIIAPTEDPDVLRVAAGSGGLDPQVAGEFLPAGDALAQLVHSRGGAIVVEKLGVGRLGAEPGPPSGARMFGVEGLGPTVEGLGP
ncbi:MAG: GAF domain-containing protein, partial [Pseudonocardiaceae bacterium]